jgi:hypothetical protein
MGAFSVGVGLGGSAVGEDIGDGVKVAGADVGVVSCAWTVTVTGVSTAPASAVSTAGATPVVPQARMTSTKAKNAITEACLFIRTSFESQFLVTRRMKASAA